MRNVFCLAAVSVGLVCAGARAADEPKGIDGEGYIRSWLVLAPIKLGDDEAGTHEEAAQKPVFAKEHFAGQKDGSPKDGEKVKAGDAEAAWRAVRSDEPVLDLGKTAEAAGKEAEKAIYFGVAYVEAAKDTADVKLSIGSDDSSVWTVNGKEAVRAYAGRAAEKDQDKSEPLALKKGVNVVRFAVINGEGPAGACARFVDKDDKPVTDLKVSLEPPAKEKAKE